MIVWIAHAKVGHRQDPMRRRPAPEEGAGLLSLHSMNRSPGGATTPSPGFGNLRLRSLIRSCLNLPMKPRGTRLACSVRTSDGCNGVYSVIPGEAPKSLAAVEPIKWDREPTGEVVQGAFTVIGEMGMTGQIVLLDAEKWRALKKTGLDATLLHGHPLGRHPVEGRGRRRGDGSARLTRAVCLNAGVCGAAATSASGLRPTRRRVPLRMATPAGTAG